MLHSFSKNPYASSNPVLKQWNALFQSHHPDHFKAEPTLSPPEIKIKMQRWLKLPRPNLMGIVPLKRCKKARTPG
jgi:hypothetical protein